METNLDIFSPGHVCFAVLQTDYGILPSAQDGGVEKHVKFVDEIALLHSLRHLEILRATAHLAHIVGTQGDSDTITELGTHLKAAGTPWKVTNCDLFTLRLLRFCKKFVETSPFCQQRELLGSQQNERLQCQRKLLNLQWVVPISHTIRLQDVCLKYSMKHVNFSLQLLLFRETVS